MRGGYLKIIWTKNQEQASKYFTVHLLLIWKTMVSDGQERGDWKETFWALDSAK